MSMQSYDIFSCSVYFIPSQVVVALQVVYHLGKKCSTTGVLPSPIDILLQFIALSRRNCVRIVLAMTTKITIDQITESNCAALCPNCHAVKTRKSR